MTGIKTKAASAPAEEIRVIHATHSHVAQPNNPVVGERANKAPNPVATPLPPRKPRKTD